MVQYQCIWVLGRAQTIVRFPSRKRQRLKFQWSRCMLISVIYSCDLHAHLELWILFSYFKALQVDGPGGFKQKQSSAMSAIGVWLMVAKCHAIRTIKSLFFIDTLRSAHNFEHQWRNTAPWSLCRVMTNESKPAYGFPEFPFEAVRVIPVTRWTFFLVQWIRGMVPIHARLSRVSSRNPQTPLCCASRLSA